ncbi:hypothetical protein ACFLX5_00065 [Chloroflexota bacterium]
MTELADYSGEFKQDLNFEDFSKEFLVRLMREWASAYLRVDECWYNEVSQRAGIELASSCQVSAWLKIAERSVPKIAKAANIQVNDVVDFLKVSQLVPDGFLSGVFECEFDIKNRNHVIFTLTRCRTLDFLEKYSPERIVSVCHGIDIPVNERYISVFLPDAKMPPLKLPDGPRKDPSETPCKWEIIGG